MALISVVNVTLICDMYNMTLIGEVIHQSSLVVSLHAPSRKVSLNVLAIYSQRPVAQELKET